MKRFDRLAAVLLIGALGAGCASTSPASVGHPASAAASEPAPSMPEPTSSFEPRLATLPTCLFETCPALGAGTYVTAGPDGFMPGLTLTLPPGFATFEHSIGELELHRSDDVDALRQLFIWRDIRAVVGVGGPAGPPEIATGVDGSPAALVAWFQTDPRFDVTEPEAVTLGSGVPATRIDVRLSAAAQNEEPLTEDGGCDPAKIVCVGVLYDPVRWVDPGYAWAMLRKAIPDPTPGECCEHMARLYFAEVGPPEDPTTLVVALSAFDVDPGAALNAWQVEAQPVLDSLVPPSHP